MKGMRHPRLYGFCLLMVTVGALRPARADDHPLLVVVESADRGGPDADLVRRSIGAELGTTVLAPGHGETERPSDVLVVALDRSTIRMSLRASTTTVVTRTIEGATDRAARLREIAWLAGNLARDQVSGLLASPLPAERPVSMASPGSEAPPPATAETRPLEPPPVLPIVAPAVSPKQPESPVEVIAARPDPPSFPTYPAWSITVAGGPTVEPRATTAHDIFTDSTYELEVQRQPDARGLVLGVALDVGSRSALLGSHLLGMAALAGISRRYGRWLFDATAGVGLELARTTESLHPTFLSAQQTVVISSADVAPSLYLRGAGSVGLALTSELDLLVRLTVHLSSAGLIGDFAGCTAGLRFRLP